MEPERESESHAGNVETYRYWAFISYSSSDKVWGRWLHRAIETYGIPAQLVSHPTPAGQPAPKRFRPLFRDRDELPASANLGVQIEDALRASRYLIVVCSPQAARSKWVNKEIETFRRFGRHERVLAVIVDGDPNTADERECFPPALREFEPIAADARSQGDGKTNAKLKLLAGMLGVSFDALKQRDAHRHIRRLRLAVAASLVVAMSLAGLTAYAFHQRNKAVKARQQAEEILQFLLYELRDSLASVGRLDLMDKVQRRVDEYHERLGVEGTRPTTLHNKASASINAGDLAKNKGDIASALQAYRAGLGILERLASAYPGNADVQGDLAISHEKLGDVLLARGNLAEALQEYRASMGIREHLAGAYPAIAICQGDLAYSHERSGDVLLAQGNLSGALQAFRTSLEIFERLAATDLEHATTWERSLQIIYNKVGDVLMMQDDVAEASQAYEAGLRIAKHLTATDPKDMSWQWDLSISQEKIGDVLQAQGDLAGALKSYRESLAIRQRLVASDASNAGWQRNLSVSHNRVGDVLLAQGDLTGALASHRASLAIAERLASSDPSNAGWQRDLSVSRGKVGDVLRDQGDLTGALASYRVSLEIRERLVSSEPSNPGWQRDLCASYCSIAYALEKSGDSLATQWWRQAYKVLSGMKQRGLFLLPQDERDLEQLRQKLGD